MHPAATEALSPEEEKILEHLKGLQSMGTTLPEHLDLEQQREELMTRQQAVNAAKAITHGHINKFNKSKSQVSSAGRKVQQLDKESGLFVETTTQKIRQHAQLFQQCRADLMESYNAKLAELTALKQEMSSASISMLGSTMPMSSIPDAPNLEKQMKELSTVRDRQERWI